MKKQLSFFVVLLAVAIIVPQMVLAAWWNPFSWGIWNRVFHFQKTEQKQEQQQKQDQKLGGDKDAHGCIGSTGYSWCEAKQKCLRQWEEKCEADPTAGWKTYKNDEYGFEIKYPANSRVTTNNGAETFWAGPEEVALNNLINIGNKPSEIGQITIRVTTSAQGKKNCFKSNFSDEGVDLGQQKMINGISFHYGSISDAAMGGRRANITYYNTIYNNACYSIEADVRWSDLEFVHGVTDQKPVTQAEIDAQNKDIQKQKDFIESVISTFKFVK